MYEGFDHFMWFKTTIQKEKWSLLFIGGGEGGLRDSLPYA